MYKSIFYKEWLKIRWFLAIFLVLGIVVLVNAFLKVRYNVNFMNAHEFWYRIIIQGNNYVSQIRLIPFIAGLGIAVAQYFPEITEKRIKLSFHLPLPENKVLLVQHGFGLMCLVAVYAIHLLIFALASSFYFPSNIISMIFITILPWFLGGLATYSMASMILLEPLWLFRVLYSVVAYGFISQFYLRAIPLAFSNVAVSFTLLALITVIVILFSGYRFRKGEMHHG